MITARTSFLLLALAAAAACAAHHRSPLPGVTGGDDGGGGGGASSGASSGGDDGPPLMLPGSSGASSSSSGGGGPVTGCDPSCTAAGGTCSGSTCTPTENPGSTCRRRRRRCSRPGAAATRPSKWLYPYDKTVFPRGLISPTLQFGGGAADSEYVHITSKTLDYKGYFAGGAAGKVTLSLSAKTWLAVTEAVGSGDAATVKVTKISGSSVAGPITETWPVAQGNIRGTVFYETYASQLISGGVESAGIMKIQPGASQPTVLKGVCGNVCHSASADGSTLVAATSLTASASYDVRNGITTINSASSTIYTYMGLYPDGSFGMAATDFRPSGGNASSRLYDTKAGNMIAAPGWDSTITKAGMPAFAPDGKQIAFMHLDSNAYTVSKMDTNVSTKTFSNLVDLTTDSSGYVAWPAFTPDGKSILYQFNTMAGSATSASISRRTARTRATSTPSTTVRRPCTASTR